MANFCISFDCDKTCYALNWDWPLFSCYFNSCHFDLNSAFLLRLPPGLSSPHILQKSSCETQTVLWFSFQKLTLLDTWVMGVNSWSLWFPAAVTPGNYPYEYILFSILNEKWSTRVALEKNSAIVVAARLCISIFLYSFHSVSTESRILRSLRGSG